MANPVALSLMSGGRDSMLATCMMIERGFDVIPFICNNGHIEELDRVYNVCSAIDERYYKEIEYRSVDAKTAMTMQKYLLNLYNLPAVQMSSKYPGLLIGQANCLACRTAMYVHAIAYCLAKGINHICDGVRECQGFYVDKELFFKRIGALCSDRGIELHTPLYGLSSDHDRKCQLCDRGLTTKTLEPQCFLGVPMTSKLEDYQEMALTNFFDNELLPHLDSDISKLVQVYKSV